MREVYGMPNYKEMSPVKVKNQPEGCFGGMKLDLSVCAKCPKGIKHWKRSYPTKFKNCDELSCQVLKGYPCLPWKEKSVYYDSIKEDHHCFITIDPNKCDPLMGGDYATHDWFLANGNDILHPEFEVVNCPAVEEHIKFNKEYPNGKKFDYKYETPEGYLKYAAELESMGFDRLPYLKYCLNVKIDYKWTYIKFLLLRYIMGFYMLITRKDELPKWADKKYSKYLRFLNCRDIDVNEKQKEKN